MNKSVLSATAVALTAITRDDAKLAASEIIASDGSPLIRLTATSQEIEALIAGIAETLWVIRNRALSNRAEDMEDVADSLAIGADQFAVYIVTGQVDERNRLTGHGVDRFTMGLWH
jgi:hypothetical protein